MNTVMDFAEVQRADIHNSAAFIEEHSECKANPISLVKRVPDWEIEVDHLMVVHRTIECLETGAKDSAISATCPSKR